MKQIRLNTFETNSSSTHSLVIADRDTYNKWMSGKVLYDTWKCRFIESDYSDKQIEDKAKELYDEDKERFWKDWEDLDKSDVEFYRVKALEILEPDAVTYDDFIDCGDDVEQSYKTEDGKEIVALAVYKDRY